MLDLFLEFLDKVQNTQFYNTIMMFINKYQRIFKIRETTKQRITVKHPPWKAALL